MSIHDRRGWSPGQNEHDGRVMSTDDTIRGLTVRQPWASAIAHGGKRTENRTWPTAYRGPVAIHAGIRLDSSAAYTGPHASAAQLALARFLQDRGPSLPTGAVLAVARIAGCHRDAGCCRPWGGPDSWHWEIDDVRPLAQPVPMRGALSLWYLSVEDVSRIQAATADGGAR